MIVLERFQRGVLFGLMLLVPWELSATSEPFSFVVPEGFVDITGESKPPLSAIDDHFYELAKSFDFLAVKLLDGDVVAACSATVIDGRAPIVNLSAGLKAAGGQLPPGNSYKVLSTSTTRFAGVDCGRIEAERTTPEGSSSVLAFVLPSPERWAKLELTVFDPAHYPEAVRAFEAAAARTRGIAPAKSPPDPPAPPLFVIGVAALIGTILGKLLRGRKRSTAWRRANELEP